MARKRSKAPRAARHGESARERECTLKAFREALTRSNTQALLTPEQRAWPKDESPEALATAIEHERQRVVPPRVAVDGVPPGVIMATRWCTALDAVRALGRCIYRRSWHDDDLETMPFFPLAEDTAFTAYAFREVVWKHHPNDPKWDRAFGAYALLVEGLAEGIVIAHAERVDNPTPRQRDGRSVTKHESPQRAESIAGAGARRYRRYVRRIAMVLVLVGGCESSSEDDGCDPASDRVGSYLFTMTQTAGNCGPIPPVVIELPAPVDSDCTLEMQTWSADMCTNMTSTRCEYEDEMGPWTMTFNGSVTQDDDDGEKMFGAVELAQFDDAGTICEGTYHVAYERQ